MEDIKLAIIDNLTQEPKFQLVDYNCAIDMSYGLYHQDVKLGRYNCRVYHLYKQYYVAIVWPKPDYEQGYSYNITSGF